MPASPVTILKDGSKDLIKALRDLANKRVMIGIPAAGGLDAAAGPNQRSDGPATNALLGYVHEHGSPARNIPARPFLVPGVENALPQASRYLRAAARAAGDGKPTEVDRNLHAAGLIAQSAVRLKITTGPFEPLAPSTLAARRRKIRAVRGRTAPGFVEVTPLVDTGAMRAAISYVVRKVK